MVGQRARCAACTLAFTIPAPTNKQSPKTPAAKQEEAAPEVPEHVGFDCRVCSTRLFARTEDVGKQLKCSDCGALTVIPPPPPPKRKNMPAALEGEQYELWDADEQPLPSQLIAAQPKSVTVKCRRCDTVMHPTANLVGQPIRCPDCGTTNIVPPPPKLPVRRSVLAPDAQTPVLDPDAHPGERPLVLAPLAKMLHEEEQEAEYAQAIEKSKRTGKAMEVDSRGRPIMPRWPLLTGIIPFLFSRGVLARWIGYSALSMIYDGLGWLILWAIGKPGGLAALGFSAILIVGFSAIGVVLLPIWLAGLASMFFTIVTESSEGNTEIKTWPSANIMDWFPEFFYVLVAVLLSGGPGCILARLALSDPILTTICVAASVVLSFPIIILSQLEIGSPFGILSFHVAKSLVKCPFSWLLFYVETAALVGACTLAAFLAEHIQILFTFLFTPLFVMSVLLYGRLLGRLGWLLAEKLGIGTE
jgi:DNA-directed RNA polymerase subunit M/transcription elongation factor TFIIS